MDPGGDKRTDQAKVEIARREQQIETGIALDAKSATTPRRARTVISPDPLSSSEPQRHVPPFLPDREAFWRVDRRPCRSLRFVEPKNLRGKSIGP